MARVSDTTRTPDPQDSITAQALEYQYLKGQIDILSKRQKVIRDELMAAVESDGFSDDQGHWWLELTGVDGDFSIQRQRRVSRSLDADAAEEILANAGVLDDCYKTVRVIDEDAVMQALYSETLTEADVDAIFPSNVTWALVVK